MIGAQSENARRGTTELRLTNSRPMKRLPVTVLISGNGSNLQAIIDAAAADLPVEIRAVISNRHDAYGLIRAQQAGIPTLVVDHRAYGERKLYERDLLTLIGLHQPEVVALAGFMRILGPEIVARYRGRMLNIHPSLLPAYRGLHTHARALEDGAREHGASVHFVTDLLDGGPVIIQARLPVLPGDTADSLAARVLEREHRIYPLVLRWLAQGRLRLEGDRVILDERPLQRPVLLETLDAEEVHSQALQS
jgi:phosphoribosylglycinamide formyltransferase-1